MEFTEKTMKCTADVLGPVTSATYNFAVGTWSLL